MVLHNPNNWHWVNKDVSPWAKEWLQGQVVGLEAEEDGASAKVDSITSMEGDVDVNQRKGKVITLFDVRLELEYSGRSSVRAVSAADCCQAPPRTAQPHLDQLSSQKWPMTPRKMSMSYVGLEFLNRPQRKLTTFLLQFEISLRSELPKDSAVKSVVRNKLVPQLRTRLRKLGPALIAEHGKDIQHAPDSNPSSGFSTPKLIPPTSAPRAAPSPKPSATSAGHTVNVTTLTDSTEFRTTAAELYRTFTDASRLAAFTRSAPLVFDGARPGGRFELFGGNVAGAFVELDEPRLVVQTWRLAQWPAGHYSTQRIRFEQDDGDHVTVMRVAWEGVPVGQEEVTRRNWGEYYVRSIKTTFGFGTVL
jgi:activator of HSP90 ATPase